MFLTKIIGRIYQICFEISLWLNLVVFTVAGGIVGNLLSSSGGWYSEPRNYTGLGIFLGLILGIISSVFVGGFIIKLLHLDD